MDPSLFVDQPSAEDFICVICLLVVKDPMVEHVDCSKTFCKPCFDQIRSNRCPHCCLITTNRMKSMHPQVRDKIYLKLEMKCSFKDCPTIIPLSQFDNHVATCRFGFSPCVHCQQLIDPKKMAEHHVADCTKYPVPCIIPGCSHMIPRNEMDQHERDNCKQHTDILLRRIKDLEDEKEDRKRSLAEARPSSSSASHVFVADDIKIRVAVDLWFSNQYHAEYCYGDISTWDTSNVTDMSELFKDREDFDENILNWDVGNVTTMKEMFKNARSFNQPLHEWDVSNVKDMFGMFESAYNFNQPLQRWNVNRVQDMGLMFYGANSFDQALSQWRVNNVRDMRSMFESATVFNHALNNWRVGNVTNMREMFAHTRYFNQPLNNWRVHNVTDMSMMFYCAESFNQPLDRWNVSNVSGFDLMFTNADEFHQNLSSWSIQQFASGTSDLDRYRYYY